MSHSQEEIPLGRWNELWYCNLYFGRKWGWKTQQVVIDAYERHIQWEIIISNIWLNFPHIRFKKWSDLPAILREIADYCNHEKLPIEAPLKMLKEYWLERKAWKVQKFFLLFDEIWNHLNTRNWNKNFKDELMRDMLTEPRKYWLTIVWVTQSWKRVDVEFREACEDWFLFSKTWKWIFERFKCTHLWVHDWEFNFEKPIILWQKQKFTYWDKFLHHYRKMYYTGEINGDWSYEKVPFLMRTWLIYAPPAPSLKTLPPVSDIEDDSPKPEGTKDNSPVVPKNKKKKVVKNIKTL